MRRIRAATPPGSTGHGRGRGDVDLRDVARKMKPRPTCLPAAHRAATPVFAGISSSSMLSDAEWQRTVLTDFPLPCCGIGDVAVRVEPANFCQRGLAALNHLRRSSQPGARRLPPATPPSLPPAARRRRGPALPTRAMASAASHCRSRLSQHRLSASSCAQSRRIVRQKQRLPGSPGPASSRDALRQRPRPSVDSTHR